MSSSQMETLNSKFNSLLNQYKETYQEYLNTINSTTNSFTSIPNSAFVSGNNTNVIQNSSVNNCMNSCSSTQSCSGATFDGKNNTCTMSSGVGNVVSSQNQTAIVKQALYYSYQLQQINSELMDLNNSIMNLANSNATNYQETQQMNAEKAQILQNNYVTLEEERIQIEEMIQEYETLNSAQQNGQINVTSNYYSYLAYLIFAIFLVFLFMKFNIKSGMQSGGGNGSKTPIFLFIFLGAIIIINAYIKNKN